MPAPQKLAMPSGRTEQVVTELTTVLDVAESPAVEGGLRLGAACIDKQLYKLW